MERRLLVGSDFVDHWTTGRSLAHAIARRTIGF